MKKCCKVLNSLKHFFSTTLLPYGTYKKKSPFFWAVQLASFKTGPKCYFSGALRVFGKTLVLFCLAFGKDHWMFWNWANPVSFILTRVRDHIRGRKSCTQKLKWVQFWKKPIGLEIARGRRKAYSKRLEKRWWLWVVLDIGLFLPNKGKGLERPFPSK